MSPPRAPMWASVREERAPCSRPARGRRTPILAAVVMCGVVGLPGLVEARPGGPRSGTDAGETDPDRTRVGPIDVSIQGRRRVRGGRPDGASIHLAWAPGIDDPDRTDREALAAFERATFPADRTHATIVTDPPAGWMRDLAMPSLPIRWNRRTIEYLQYFKDDRRGQAMMRAWMRRAGRYEGRLRKILREVGVPEDLVMVALAESGFHPGVRSRVGAGGLWQFMEGTGSVYGLDRDYWIDERFDIEKSTHAAALYLEDLHVRFGSWELALAAFNAGYGLVMTTIERHNTNNYWALCEIESGLPYATTNYVPKIMAAALVSANRRTFGVTASEIDSFEPIDWIEVSVRQSTSLRTLAKALDMDRDVLAEINAHLIRGRTPPRRGTYAVRIPRDKADAFQASQHRLRTAWAEESTHVVKNGESLTAIASAHGITARDLRSMNGVDDEAEVSGGVVLVVPATRVARTDVPAPTRPLAAVPRVTPPSGTRLVFYVATPSTTPRTIETTFGVRWKDVVTWNDLDPHARLQADQVLQLLVPAGFDAAAHDVVAYEHRDVDLVVRGSVEHLEAALARRGMIRRGYVVKKGDTLARIGRKFGLSVGDLARINAFSRDHDPPAGDVVTVYVQERHARSTVDAPGPKQMPTPTAPASTGRTPSTAATSRVPGAGATPGAPGAAP